MMSKITFIITIQINGIGTLDSRKKLVQVLTGTGN